MSCEISGSILDSTTLSGSNATNSTINSSTATNSVISNSPNTVINSTVTNSTIENSTVMHGTINNSFIYHSNLTSLTTLTANVTSDYCYSGSIIYNSLTYLCPISLESVYDQCGDIAETCQGFETCTSCAADCGACPAEDSDDGTGGSGGGGTTSTSGLSTCETDWECSEWSSCQPSGQQSRSCNDLNGCKPEESILDESQPSESQSCSYESCDDGIMNQDEDNIDCGGVCDECVACETDEDCPVGSCINNVCVTYTPSGGAFQYLEEVLIDYTPYWIGFIFFIILVAIIVYLERKYRRKHLLTKTLPSQKPKKRLESWWPIMKKPLHHESEQINIRLQDVKAGKVKEDSEKVTLDDRLASINQKILDLRKEVHVEPVQKAKPSIVRRVKERFLDRELQEVSRKAHGYSKPKVKRKITKLRNELAEINEELRDVSVNGKGKIITRLSYTRGKVSSKSKQKRLQQELKETERQISSPTVIAAPKVDHSKKLLRVENELANLDNFVPKQKKVKRKPKKVKKKVVKKKIKRRKPNYKKIKQLNDELSQVEEDLYDL